ncbi:MAG: hypothetical protein NW217_07070 [Hyphomicrobiaceae bacterium]|nr:hypothetical protein [Hyphomicrobiaceae bacterium]
MPLTRAVNAVRPVLEKLPLDRLKRYLPWPSGGGMRLVFAALCGSGILHIVATLSAPQMLSRSAYARLSPTLPTNTMSVLPPISPVAQPLPFLSPATRLAVCHYDTARGPVDLQVSLPGPGWMLSLHTPGGANIYSAAGQDGRPIVLKLRIVPSAERFMGLTPEALGTVSTRDTQQTVESARGIAIIQAPDRGEAYRPFIDAALAQARCQANTF